MPSVNISLDQLIQLTGPGNLPINTVNDVDFGYITKNTFRSSDETQSPLTSIGAASQFPIDYYEYATGVLLYVYCLDLNGTSSQYFYSFGSPGTFPLTQFGPPNTSQGIPQWAPFDKRVYIADRGTAWGQCFYAINGSTFVGRRQGIPTYEQEPGGVFSLTYVNGGTGLWAGGDVGVTFYYKFSYKINNAIEVTEGNASSTVVSHIINNTNDELKINVPVAPSTFVGTKGVIYRRRGSSGNYEYLTEVTLGTTYTDLGNVSTDAVQIAPVDNTRIDFIPSNGIIHQDRYWACEEGTDQLRFSQIGYPDYMPAENALTIGVRDDPFQQLISLANYLLVFKQRSIWMVEGSTLADFRVTQIAYFGTQARLGAFFYENYFYMFSKNGLIRWQIGGAPEMASATVEKIFDDYIETYGTKLFNYGIDPTTGYIWIIFKTSISNGQGVIFYDPKSNKWVGRNKNVPIVAFNNTNKFLTSAQPGCRIFKRNSGNNGSEISAPLAKTSGGVNVNFIITFNTRIADKTSVKKLYRQMQLTYQLVSGGNFNMVCSCVRSDGVTVNLGSYLVTSGNSQLAIPIGETDEGLKFILNGTTGRFFISNIEIEYEEVGNW